MADVDQVRLVRTKKISAFQLFLYLFYTMRNGNWLVVGEVKSGRTVIAFAIQNILYLHQMNGIDSIERNSLRSWHFSFLIKVSAARIGRPENLNSLVMGLKVLRNFPFAPCFSLAIMVKLTEMALAFNSILVFLSKING